MKRFATVLLVMAMLCTVSCKDNASVPAETTENTTTAAETAETTENTTTAAETAEPVDITSFLDGITVHEYDYDSDKKGYSQFDDVGSEEYLKYTEGKEFDEYYAVKYESYVLVGRIITEPNKSRCYSRVIDSIIHKGERFYLDEDASLGKELRWYETEDLVCITMGAITMNGVLYIHDSGVEYHNKNDALANGVDNVYIKDGKIVYVASDNEYKDFRHCPDKPISADTRMYESGTVQILDGHIKYVAEELYTVREWYDTAHEFRSKSGCDTVEEFLQWFVDYYNSGAWETDTDRIWLP